MIQHHQHKYNIYNKSRKYNRTSMKKTKFSPGIFPTRYEGPVNYGAAKNRGKVPDTVLGSYQASGDSVFQ